MFAKKKIKDADFQVSKSEENKGKSNSELCVFMFKISKGRWCVNFMRQFDKKIQQPKMMIKAKLKRDWGFPSNWKIYANFIVLNIELSVDVEVNIFTHVCGSKCIMKSALLFRLYDTKWSLNYKKNPSSSMLYLRTTMCVGFAFFFYRFPSSSSSSSHQAIKSNFLTQKQQSILWMNRLSQNIDNLKSF